MSNDVHRILDANLNRAREAVRVIEEYVRFIRDDRTASERIKHFRHRLRSIADALGPDRLLAARASDADVGKDIPSPSQTAKVDPRSILAASCKRLQEALRSIEEYASPVGHDVSALAGSLRFEAYQWEKNLLLATNPRQRFEPAVLYLLIGSDVCDAERIVPLSADLLDAGVDCLQLREKRLVDREFLKLADGLCDVCRSKNKLFIVNDRPDIAKAVSAHGVHVGQDDLPVAAVRAMVPDAVIGISTHTIDQVQAAIVERPTYIAVGPAFPTETKPHEPVVGTGFIRKAIGRLNNAGVPHVAIGGITAENLEDLLACNVARIAVASAVLDAADPVTAAHTFAQKLRNR